MKLHIRYLIKPDMLHNDRVKLAAANSSGLGKWKVTPHFDQGMDERPGIPGYRGPTGRQKGFPPCNRRPVRLGWVIILCAVQ